jgi:hypothetical protein
MMYGIILRGKDGYPYWFHDAILPGLIPDHVFDRRVCRVVDEQLGLCKICDVQGSRCHVFEEVIDGETGEETTGRKMCPVLFADAVKPPWRVDQVV